MLKKWVRWLVCYFLIKLTLLYFFTLLGVIIKLILSLVMAENFSFDVVSDFNRQELVNALDQVKEISQRYDLKGQTLFGLEKENIFITTNSELTLNSVIDIIRQKAIKRKLSLKIFDYSSIEVVSGNKVKQTITLKRALIRKLQKNQ